MHSYGQEISDDQKIFTLWLPYKVVLITMPFAYIVQQITRIVEGQEFVQIILIISNKWVFISTPGSAIHHVHGDTPLF